MVMKEILWLEKRKIEELKGRISWNKNEPEGHHWMLSFMVCIIVSTSSTAPNLLVLSFEANMGFFGRLAPLMACGFPQMLLLILRVSSAPRIPISAYATPSALHIALWRAVCRDSKLTHCLAFRISFQILMKLPWLFDAYICMPVRPAPYRQHRSMPSARAIGRRPWTKATERQTTERSERNPSQSALDALLFSREFLWNWFILSYPWACHRWHLGNSGETLTAPLLLSQCILLGWL